MPNTVTVPAGYTVTFVSAPCINGSQVFTYNVTIPETTPQGCGLSSVAFQLCSPTIHMVTDFTNGLGGEVNVDSNFPLQPCMSALNPLALQQVKFNTAGELAPGTYTVSFTLAGCFELTDVTLAIHVGEACQVGGGGCQHLANGEVPTITGPSCNETPPPPPPGRGVGFEKIETLTEE